jgi:CheY-like chemotaxis protein
MSATATVISDLEIKNSTILIIDDNTTVLNIAVEYLQEGQFVALAAQDGIDAIKVCPSQPNFTRRINARN